MPATKSILSLQSSILLKGKHFLNEQMGLGLMHGRRFLQRSRLKRVCFFHTDGISCSDYKYDLGSADVVGASCSSWRPGTILGSCSVGKPNLFRRAGGLSLPAFHSLRGEFRRSGAVWPEICGTARYDRPSQIPGQGTLQLPRAAGREACAAPRDQ